MGYTCPQRPRAPSLMNGRSQTVSTHKFCRRPENSYPSVALCLCGCSFLPVFRESGWSSGSVRRSSSSAVRRSCRRSFELRRARPVASFETRRLRPSFRRRLPLAVAETLWTRSSPGSGLRLTRPWRSRSLTRREIVGGRTCSAAASSPIVTGPPKTMTERADRRGAERPEALSSRRSLRSKWMAAEWRRSASSRFWRDST